MEQHALINDIQAAWQLASRLHDGQKYGGPVEPEQIEYINHIGSVVFEVYNAINYTKDVNAGLAILCAILHDTIEDTPITYEELKAMFGLDVAEGVLALTKDEKIGGHLEQMLDSLTRIRKQPAEIWAVKLADRITNLSAPPYYWNDQKKIKYLEEAQVILAQLKDGNAYLAKRLSTKITEYNCFIGVLGD